ncbi:hypothetical protein RvY_05915-2 [Ramazzottius varieornatus]|uniref:Uncharacterized protein n=1 Tax=Ramazzottius varieornatus TaxID=947166 RepID=A0A1D1UX70_RAMVA|nr:hypothetical protein RvY_05915-2 [Ramazzottius varieornatus]
MAPVEIADWCTSVGDFFKTVQTKVFAKDTAKVKEYILLLSSGLLKVQGSIVRMLAEKIEQLPAQIEDGIRNATKQAAQEAQSIFRTTAVKNTFADMFKRNPNVLILKPVDGGEQNGHRKSNRELTELGSKVKTALGLESYQVKLGGIRSTANNGAVYEFATREDRDKAKTALENCSATTKYTKAIMMDKNSSSTSGSRNYNQCRKHDESLPMEDRQSLLKRYAMRIWNNCSIERHFTMLLKASKTLC